MIEFVLPYSKDLNLLFISMIEELNPSDTSKLELISSFFNVEFDDVVIINHHFSESNLNYKLFNVLFKDYKNSLLLSGDTFSFQEYVTDSCLYLNRYLPVINMIKKGFDDDFIVKNSDFDSYLISDFRLFLSCNNRTTNNLSFADYEFYFYEQFAKNALFLFFIIIESIDLNEIHKLTSLSILFSLELDNIVFIKEQHSLGNLNLKIFSLVFDDYRKQSVKDSKPFSFSGFISNFHSLYSRYYHSILLIKLGATRENITVLTRTNMDIVKRLRKFLEVSSTITVSQQVSEYASDIFNFIELNSLTYFAIFEEGGSLFDLNRVLIEISKDLYNNGVTFSPFSHLLKALIYHYDNGVMVNTKLNSKYYSSVLVERIDHEYRFKGKSLHQKRLLNVNNI